MKILRTENRQLFKNESCSRRENVRRRCRRPRCHRVNAMTVVGCTVLPSLATIVWLMDICFLHLFDSQRRRRSRPGSVTSILLSLKTGVLLPAIANTPPQVVDHRDYIYSDIDWDAAPIVVPRFKLVFFTVPKIGCTVWKQLFRRMMGVPDWNQKHFPMEVLHNPNRNKLYYLYDFPRTSANYMLTSPNWTRAIFTRDPKVRLLSAFLDKTVRERHYIRNHCCRSQFSVVPAKATTVNRTQIARKKKYRSNPSLKFCKQDPSNWTFESFIRFVMPHCPDPHWKPQSQRMDEKHWAVINFVGRIESAADDARRLLERLGAYEDFGSKFTRIPSQHFLPIFAANMVKHSTKSSDQLPNYYTSDLERLVESFYSDDYSHPVLNLSLLKIDFNKSIT